MKASHLIPIAMILAAPVMAPAESGRSFEILNLAMTPRQAMVGALGEQGPGALTGLFDNPALLGRLEAHVSFTANVHALYATTLLSAGGAVRMGHFHLGAAFGGLDLGLVRGDGLQIDDPSRPLTTRIFMFSGTVAWSLHQAVTNAPFHLHLGVSLRSAHEALDSAQYAGQFVSAGLQIGIPMGSRWDLGLSAQTDSWFLAWQGNHKPSAPPFHTGTMQVRFNPVPSLSVAIAGSGRIEGGSDPEARLSARVRFLKHYFVAATSAWGRLSAWTVGGGVEIHLGESTLALDTAGNPDDFQAGAMAGVTWGR